MNSLSFWREHHRLVILTAIPAWVIFIVGMYFWTRPRDPFAASANVLKVGALPVT